MREKAKQDGNCVWNFMKLLLLNWIFESQTQDVAKKSTAFFAQKDHDDSK